MKVFILLLAFAALSTGEPVNVVNSDAPEVSIIGYLVDVAVPAAEARKKAELEYLNSNNKIVGGLPAVSGQFPWQAALISDIIGVTGNGICGASLISHNRLVTAAHCWFDGRNQAWRYTVVLGDVLLFGNSGVREQTSVVVTHPSWSPYLVRNDVAVIYLPEPVPFSSTISPVNLPSGTELAEDFVGERVVASGFGLKEDGGSITLEHFLSHVQLQVVTNQRCRLSFPVIVQESNICTSGAGGQGPCRGDSGGPLVAIRNGRPILIGITSFGSPQCEAGRPGAFTRVTSFIDFITGHLA